MTFNDPFRRFPLTVLVVAILAAAAAPDASAARRRIPCGGFAEKVFGQPKPLAFRIANEGDCWAIVQLQDVTGHFFVSELLNPGDSTRWIGRPDVRIAHASVFVEPVTGFGAVLVVRPFAGLTDYDAGECSDLKTTEIYHQFFTCPPTAAPGITVKNTGDCDIVVIGVRATLADWSGEMEVPLHTLNSGQSTPIMADAVRRYRVRCLGTPAGRCRFEVTK